MLKISKSNDFSSEKFLPEMNGSNSLNSPTRRTLVLSSLASAASAAVPATVLTAGMLGAKSAIAGTIPVPLYSSFSWDLGSNLYFQVLTGTNERIGFVHNYATGAIPYVSRSHWITLGGVNTQHISHYASGSFRNHPGGSGYEFTVPDVPRHRTLLGMFGRDHNGNSTVDQRPTIVLPIGSYLLNEWDSLTKLSSRTNVIFFKTYRNSSGVTETRGYVKHFNSSTSKVDWIYFTAKGLQRTDFISKITALENAIQKHKIAIGAVVFDVLVAVIFSVMFCSGWGALAVGSATYFAAGTGIVLTGTTTIDFAVKLSSAKADLAAALKNVENSALSVTGYTIVT